jgi:recombination protein RecA
MATKKSKKKTSKESKKNKSSLDIALQSISKEYGMHLDWLSEAPEEDEVIPTGSLSLDYALGRGGLVRGRMVEIYGSPKGGKSTLAMSIIAEAQKLGGRALYVDAERALDKRLPSKYGCDPSNFLLIDNCYCGEDYIDVMEKLLRTGEFAVAVLDSVPGIVPRAVLDASINQMHMGIHARLISDMVKRFLNIIGETKTLLICINQIRYKIGAYGDPRTTPGGQSIPFFSSYRIEVSGGDTKANKIFHPVTNNIIGHTMQFHTVKNKLGPPYRKGAIDLIYGKGYDSVGEIVSLGEDLNVFERAAAWYKYKGETIANGKDKAKEYLVSNPDVTEEVIKEIKAILSLDA